MSARDQERRAELAVFGAFALAAAAAVSLAVVYALGGQPQAEGALLGTALLSLGGGLVLWAHRLLPGAPATEEREVLPTTAEDRAAFAEEVEEEGRGVLGRRRLLTVGLGGALAAFAAAAVFPIRSLGPRPGRALLQTPWAPGVRVVDETGHVVGAADVPLEGLVTVFPEGHVGSADGQVVLVRVPAHLLQLPPERADWAPDGLVAYSKVCTHLGCPVGLYQRKIHQLLCPCHQSAFAVLEGARPVFGPAARALPQLPLEIDDEGVLRARSDFPEPVGPTWWSRP